MARRNTKLSRPIKVRPVIEDTEKYMKFIRNHLNHEEEPLKRLPLGKRLKFLSQNLKAN